MWILPVDCIALTIIFTMGWCRQCSMARQVQLESSGSGYDHAAAGMAHFSLKCHHIDNLLNVIAAAEHGTLVVQILWLACWQPAPDMCCCMHQHSAHPHSFWWLNRGTVTYLDIHDDPTMTIGIFQLPPGARMPLHDHPGMTVFSR